METLQDFSRTYIVLYVIIYTEEIAATCEEMLTP